MDTLCKYCSGIIMIEELSKPVLVYWCSIFLITPFFYQKCYMLPLLMYKVVCMIWRSLKYFLYYFLVFMFIRRWVLLWTMKGLIWKFMVYFILVIFDVVSFLLWKLGIFGHLTMNSNPYPQKKLACSIPLDSKF